MNLTSVGFLLLLLFIAAVLIAATYLLWSRWPRAIELPARILCLLVLMGWGAIVVLDQINRTYDFYSSLSDLFGRPPSAHALAVLGGPKPQAGVQVTTVDWQPAAIKSAAQGHGTLLDVIYLGARSGITRAGQLYLPAAYFTEPKDRRFAAIEFFPGFPGAPEQFQNLLGIRERLDTEIAAGRMPPVIGVFPRTYVGHASECVNAVHGEQDATYLAVDVQDDVQRSFRLLPGRSWATIGVSEGGFCAVNLGLQHPERYSAAASLSGYFKAGEDIGASALYRGSRTARLENSPLWWVMHRAPTAPALFLFASQGAPEDMREITAMQAALQQHARALPAKIVIAGSGGHNWGVWAGTMDPALDWLGGFLPQPLAPPLIESNTTSTTS